MVDIIILSNFFHEIKIPLEFQSKVVHNVAG